MKQKLIDSTKPVKTRKDGWQITVQLLDQDKLLVLNVWVNKNLHARHCLNLETGEYATKKKNLWTKGNLWEALSAAGESWRSNECYYYTPRNCPIPGQFVLSKKNRAALEKRIPATYKKEDIFDRIERIEREFGRCKRETTEKNRYYRAQEIMGQVPHIPQDFPEWLMERLTHGEDYFLKNPESGMWKCSHCGNQSQEQELKRADGGKKLRHNDDVICPMCHKTVRFLKQNKGKEQKGAVYLIQPIDQDKSVVRLFEARVAFNGTTGKRLYFDETIRLIIYKTECLNRLKRKKDIEIYYLQSWKNFAFDCKGNTLQVRWHTGYLYDGGAEEALKDTPYEAWGRVFREMAKTDVQANFDSLLAYKDAVNVAELLFKGRFFRLLREMSEKIHPMSDYYNGSLNLYGTDIHTVFGLQDMQKINRIRDRNGGEAMLDWLKYQERTSSKLSDKVLDWLIVNHFQPASDNYYGLSLLKHGFTPEQAMNYIKRQKKESYQKEGVRWISNQYADYIRMCEQLGKDVTDEMVYRPRELKKRHDEAVEEFRQREAEITAAEYSKKYSAAEAVLKTIKEKLEYIGEDYQIIVPQRIVDIVREGNALHHCAGATDRYFDRIKQQETYICFLRKTEKPDEPFYTIEVEPGGTIRQHRGMYDEEPDIDKIRPFLKLWQQEIRRRMQQADHELAAISVKKREENIADLKAKNNTRVLKGLMEDFMEAAAI